MNTKGENLPLKEAPPQCQTPPGDWYTWFVLANEPRDEISTGATTIHQWVMSGKCRNIALIAKDKRTACEEMVRGDKGILAAHSHNDRPIFYISTGELHWSNGAKARIFSGRAHERLRGPQFDGAWVHGLSQFSRAEDTWDQLMFP